MFYENLRVLKEIQKNIKRSKLPLIQNIFTLMAAHQLTQTATWLLVDRFLAILGTIIKIKIGASVRRSSGRRSGGRLLAMT